MKKWTIEECIEEAKKYTNLKDFRLLSNSAYVTSIRKGWFSEFTWLKRYDCRVKWTKETVEKEILKYTTLSDFRKKSPMAYERAKQYKLDLSKLTKSYNINDHNWLVYAYEIQNRYVYIGLTIDIKRRDYEHRTKDKKDSLAKFCKENNIILEKDSYIIKESNLTAEEAQELEDRLVKDYKNLGNWEIVNSGKTGIHVGSLGSGIRKWDKDSCIEAAKTCKYRNEFKKKYPRAYTVSHRNKWIDEFTWLNNKPKSNRLSISITVLQFDKSGNLIQEFSSCRVAAEAFNLKGGASAIRAVCNGRRKTAAGYIWKYKRN